MPATSLHTLTQQGSGRSLRVPGTNLLGAEAGVRACRGRGREGEIVHCWHLTQPMGARQRPWQKQA